MSWARNILLIILGHQSVTHMKRRYLWKIWNTVLLILQIWVDPWLLRFNNWRVVVVTIVLLLAHYHSCAYIDQLINIIWGIAPGRLFILMISRCIRGLCFVHNHNIDSFLLIRKPVGYLSVYMDTLFHNLVSFRVDDIVRPNRIRPLVLLDLSGKRRRLPRIPISDIMGFATLRGLLRLLKHLPRNIQKGRSRHQILPGIRVQIIPVLLRPHKLGMRVRILDLKLLGKHRVLTEWLLDRLTYLFLILLIQLNYILPFLFDVKFGTELRSIDFLDSLSVKLFLRLLIFL